MNKPMLNEFNTLTFDVVGTLIDFETGILEWFRPTLAKKSVEKSDEEILTGDQHWGSRLRHSHEV